jgi:Ni,Fe-hydrogenase III small subunit
MELALRKTYDAMSAPRLVVAVGACGCSGGMTGAFIVIIAARTELRRDLSCAGSSSLSQARPFAP